MPATAKSAPCPEEQRLLTLIHECIERIRAISDDEIVALARRDFAALNRQRDQMTKARERKAAMMDLYDAHTREHGC